MEQVKKSKEKTKVSPPQRKKEPPATPHKEKNKIPGELVISLNDPGMTPTLKAGLGGLAASLRRMAVGNAWPSQIQVGPGLARVNSTQVILSFGEKPPLDTLSVLFAQSFQVKDDLIYLPGAQHPNTPPSLPLRIAQQRGLKKTFLQHGMTTKKGQIQKVSFEIDAQTTNEQYQGYKDFIHRDPKTLEALAKSLSGKRMSLAGWASPGAACRHEAYKGQTEWSYDVKQALCGCFALVGCLSFEVTQAGGAGALVIPEPSNLLSFADARGQLSPRQLSEAYVAGASDAVLSVSLALRMVSDLDGHPSVEAVHGVLLKSTPWASQQKSRISTISLNDFSDKTLTKFDAVAKQLPARLLVTKDDTKKPAKPDEEKPGYFAVASTLRNFIAENLAAGRPWYQGFALAKNQEKKPRFLHYYRTKENLGALRSEEKKGLLAMINSLEESENLLIQSIHIALRRRFGAIATEAQNSVTMRKRFQGERDKWRLAFSGAKTHEQIRAALADLWSRAGANSVLQGAWPQLLPLLRHEKWQAAKDLALIALASYQSERKEELEESNESLNQEND